MSEHKIGMRAVKAIRQEMVERDGKYPSPTTEAFLIERKTGINKTISMLISCHFVLSQIETRDAFDDNRRLRKMKEIKTLLAEYGETV